MAQAVGCAAIFAALTLIPSLLISLAVGGEANLPERLLVGSILPVVTFAAVFLLCCRDYAFWSLRFRSVRKRLLKLADINDSDCLDACPDVDARLALQTRQVIGEFFDVPSTKIHPNRDLKKLLQWDRLEPGISGFVGVRMLELNQIERTFFCIETQEFRDLVDLTRAIQRILVAEGGQTGDDP